MSNPLRNQRHWLMSKMQFAMSADGGVNAALVIFDIVDNRIRSRMLNKKQAVIPDKNVGYDCLCFS